MSSLQVTFSNGNGGTYIVSSTVTFEKGNGSTGTVWAGVLGGQSTTVYCDDFERNLQLACTFEGIIVSTTIYWPGDAIVSPNVPVTVELYGVWPGSGSLKVVPSGGAAATMRRSQAVGRGLAFRKPR